MKSCEVDIFAVAIWGAWHDCGAAIFSVGSMAEMFPYLFALEIWLCKRPRRASLLPIIVMKLMNGCFSWPSRWGRFLFNGGTNQETKNMWSYIFSWTTKITKVLVCDAPFRRKIETNLRGVIFCKILHLAATWSLYPDSCYSDQSCV